MTIQEASSLKKGDKIKEVKISSGFSKIGEIYEIDEVRRSENTVEDVEKLMSNKGMADKTIKSFFDAAINEIKSGLNFTCFFKSKKGLKHSVSASGLMRNFQKK